MKAEDVDKRMALITPTLTYDDLKDADIIIEAVFENMEVKKASSSKLDAVAKPGAVLATNTSGLDVNEIATLHQAAGRRHRHALLLAGQRHEAAGERARQGDRRRTSSPR